jgi:hypothetical protein
MCVVGVVWYPDTRAMLCWTYIRTYNGNAPLNPHTQNCTLLHTQLHTMNTWTEEEEGGGGEATATKAGVDGSLNWCTKKRSFLNHKILNYNLKRCLSLATHALTHLAHGEHPLSHVRDSTGGTSLLADSTASSRFRHSLRRQHHTPTIVLTKICLCVVQYYIVRVR